MQQEEPPLCAKKAAQTTNFQLTMKTKPGKIMLSDNFPPRIFKMGAAFQPPFLALPLPQPRKKAKRKKNIEQNFSFLP